jgi:UrcA family protein
VKTLPIAFATVLAAAAVNVNATETSRQVSGQRVVRFADLDLSKPADVARLHRRVWTAARDLCWQAGVLSIYHGPSIQRCAREAAERALAEING